MKLFEMRELRAAQEYAMDGGQALHCHTMNAGHPLFRKYPVVGHLFDQDKRRLVHLAQRLGVKVIKVEHEGSLKQHIDLCGKPFDRAIEIIERMKVSVTYVEADEIAESFVEQLLPLCERVEISGELRRLQEEIHSIDILVQPEEDHTRINALLEAMRADGMIEFEKLGPLSKKFYLPKSGIWVQIYAVSHPATWGVRSVTLTGPDDFTHWMVSRRVTGGALPDHLYVSHGAVVDGRTGYKLKTPEETDYFDLAGLPWIRPQNRVARWSR